MGSNAAETVEEIREVRDRLAHEISDLEHRLPQPANVARRAVKIAAGGGVGGAAVWMIARRVRKKKQAKKAQEQARPVVNTVVHVIPEKWGESLAKTLDGNRMKKGGTIALAMYVLMKLAELRILRRMTRLAATNR